MLVFIMMSPGTTGTDKPPGMTAFSLRPPFTPPHRSNRSLNGIPSGNSRFAGFSTWPETEKITVPAAFLGPSCTNHSGPLRNIAGTEAKLWVLLMVVGAPYRPKLAGNGGLNRGFAGLPSPETKIAGSSPPVVGPAPHKRV